MFVKIYCSLSRFIYNVAFYQRCQNTLIIGSNNFLIQVDTWQYRLLASHTWLGNWLSPNLDQDVVGITTHFLVPVTILLSQLGGVWKESMGDHHHGRNGPEHLIIGSFERLIRDLSETYEKLIRDWSSDHTIRMFWCRGVGCARTGYHREANVFVQTTHNVPYTCIIWVSWILFTFCFWSRAARGASPWCSSARCRCSSSSAGSRPAGPSAPSSSEKVAPDEKVSLRTDDGRKTRMAFSQAGPFWMSSSAHSCWGVQDMLVSIRETNRKIC